MADFSFDASDFEALVNQATGTVPDDDPAKDAGELYGKWVPETLADAYADDTPIEFLVDGLIPIPSLSIVYGGPGTLKSMLLADLAVCVAAGSIWLEAMADGEPGGVSFVTRQSPVLWLDFDNGKKRTRQRMAALGRGHDQPGDTALHYISMAMPWLNASDNTLVTEVAKYVKHGGYKLLIIDNLGLVNGGIEENSSEMAQVMGLLRWLSEEAECAVIVIHHQRKGAGAGQNDPGQRKGDTLRGHSTIEASLDMALLVERKGREDALLVIPTKTRDYHRFDFFGALWTYEHFPDNTGRMKAGRFFARSVATGEEAYNRAIIETAKAELRKAKVRLPVKDLIDLTRDTMSAKPGGKPPGISKVRGLLREAAERGELFQEGSATRKVYWI